MYATIIMRYKLILKPDGSWLHVLHFDDGSILRWRDGIYQWGHGSVSAYKWHTDSLCECLLRALLSAEEACSLQAA